MCWVIGSAAFSVERLKRFSKGSKNLEFVCFCHWGFLKTTPNTHFFFSFLYFFLITVWNPITFSKIIF